MGITSGKKNFQLTRITNLVETEPSAMSKNFTNMSPDYGSLKSIVPNKVAGTSDIKKRSMNSTGKSVA